MSQIQSIRSPSTPERVHRAAPDAGTRAFPCEHSCASPRTSSAFRMKTSSLTTKTQTKPNRKEKNTTNLHNRSSPTPSNHQSPHKSSSTPKTLTLPGITEAQAIRSLPEIRTMRRSAFKIAPPSSFRYLRMRENREDWQRRGRGDGEEEKRCVSERGKHNGSLSEWFLTSLGETSGWLLSGWHV